MKDEIGSRLLVTTLAEPTEPPTSCELSPELNLGSATTTCNTVCLPETCMPYSTYDQQSGTKDGIGGMYYISKRGHLPLTTPADLQSPFHLLWIQTGRKKCAAAKVDLKKILLWCTIYQASLLTTQLLFSSSNLVSIFNLSFKFVTLSSSCIGPQKGRWLNQPMTTQDTYQAVSTIAQHHIIPLAVTEILLLKALISILCPFTPCFWHNSLIHFHHEHRNIKHLVKRINQCFAKKTLSGSLQDGLLKSAVSNVTNVKAASNLCKRPSIMVTCASGDSAELIILHSFHFVGGSLIALRRLGTY